MATYLDEIIASHRAAARADTRPVEGLIEAAKAAEPVRPFRAALRADGLSVIAEIKRRSPSKGDLAPDLDPGVLAKDYEAGGAACLSVLTDETYFGGSAADVTAARAAVDLPVLRKDFTVSEADVCDARIMGADAVLLIAAALDDAELVAFRALAGELRLAALVEVHDEAELERAVAAGADLVGVNQRDLRTFEVDRELASRLAERMPADVVKVAESGVRDQPDASALRAAGYDAVLVGESLVTAGDPAEAVRAMRCS
ncbi:MAG: indole-3-glycerol phosphate synthase [Actinomycetota bacterium]